MTNRHLQSDFDLRCCHPFISLFRMNVFGWKITFQWQTTRKRKKNKYTLIDMWHGRSIFVRLLDISITSQPMWWRQSIPWWIRSQVLYRKSRLCNIDLNGIFISSSLSLPLPIFILHFSSYLWHAVYLFWRRQYDNTSTWHGNNRQQKIAIRGKKSNTKLT